MWRHLFYRLWLVLQSSAHAVAATNVGRWVGGWAVRVAATAGAGKRRASEQRIAIRDFGTCTHFTFFSLFIFVWSRMLRLHMCVCVCVCVCVWEREREGKNSCLPFLWGGKCIRQSGGKTKERSPVLRHLPKELLKSSPNVCLYAFCKCSLLK